MRIGQVLRKDRCRTLVLLRVTPALFSLRARTTAARGHEQHVLSARPFDGAAGNQSAAVAQQHDLEYDARS